MDLCLNITTNAVPKISATENITKKNDKVIKSFKPKIAQHSNSFEFKWDTTKKTKNKAIVFNKNKGQKNIILPQKQNEQINTSNNENNNKELKQLTTINKSKQENNETSPTTDQSQNPAQKNKEFKQFASKKQQKHKLENIDNEKKFQTPDFKKHGYPLFDKFSEAAKGKMFQNIEGKSKVEQVFSKKGTKFKDLGIHQHTVTNLERIGLSTLTAVQERAIPEIMSGKNVFVRSQTGSGKTLAYAIPIIESLRSIEPHINRKDGIYALIVLPTRELALQTYELFLKLVEPFRWIVPGRLCGGENRNSEKARLRKGISVLIGTPGRLLDHALHTQNLKLDKVKCLVLDEADRLLDMGFQKDVNKLIEKITESKNLDYDPLEIMKNKITKFDEETKIIKSKDRQTILLSATLTSNVKDLATFTLTDYVYIDPLNPNSQTDINNLPDSDLTSDVAIPQSLKQQFVVTDVKTKLVVLSSFIVAKATENNCKMFVFMASRPMVEYHEMLFKKCLIKRPKKENNDSVKISLDESDDDTDDDVDHQEDVLDLQFFKLHGSMDQKERTEVFKSFRSAKKGVLLCTDVAARGVDIPHADYVVQYTSPLNDQDYIHRVGRTGRAGHKGLALLFVTEPELNYVSHLKDRNIILKREQQDNILKHLLVFMDHARPASIQAAAEILQKRYEKAVLKEKSLHNLACQAYSTWSRYYSSYPQALKEYFNIKKAHLGHYVTSFALRDNPQQVGKNARNQNSKNEDVRLNKKLQNHETEEANIVKPLRPKKRPRDQELVMSEFDSGLPKKKKKNK